MESDESAEFFEGGDFLQFFTFVFETGMSPEDVDGFVARGRHQPGARIGRGSLGRPLFDRHREGLLSHLLG
jgi:hypothetical protein